MAARQSPNKILQSDPLMRVKNLQFGRIATKRDHSMRNTTTMFLVLAGMKLSCSGDTMHCNGSSMEKSSGSRRENLLRTLAKNKRFVSAFGAHFMMDNMTDGMASTRHILHTWTG